MTEIISNTKKAEFKQDKASPPKFLTINEFVETTKVSRQTISRKIKLGEIPSFKIGRRILIPLSFLESLEKAAWSSLKN